MRRILGIVMILSVMTGIAFDAAAQREKKNEPRGREVEDTLEALGGEHFPEDMSIRSVDSIEIGDTYYHVFQGELDSDEYQIYIYDNYGNYLGFYKSPYPASNYEREGHISLETGDVDELGNPLRFFLPLTKGPPPIVVIGAAQTPFVKAPVEEGAESETTPSSGDAAEEGSGSEKTSAADEKAAPEFREWNITLKGKTYKVPAMYVSQTFATVTLRGEGTGNKKEFPIGSLSPEDREYIEQFK